MNSTIFVILILALLAFILVSSKLELREKPAFLLQKEPGIRSENPEQGGADLFLD